MCKTLLLNKDDVHENVQMPEFISAIEDAFVAYESGDAQMPPKFYTGLPQYNGDFRLMSAYLDTGDWGAAGIKQVDVHLDNSDKYDPPIVMGMMIYSDPESAFPLTLLDGTEFMMLRTGAAAAVVTDHLAVEDAFSMGIVGAGVQSYMQLRAISEVRDIEEVVVSDLDEERVANLIDVFEDELDIHTGSIEEVANCNVLSTVTPVELPIVPCEVIGDHIHTNAMGADAEGKHELVDEVLLGTKFVVDDHAQTTHSGEINVPYHGGVPTDDDIYGAIGDIVLGNPDSRTDADGTSVLDSTGFATQGVAAAHVVYEHVLENDNGYALDLLGFAE